MPKANFKAVLSEIIQHHHSRFNLWADPKLHDLRSPSQLWDLISLWKKALLFLRPSSAGIYCFQMSPFDPKPTALDGRACWEGRIGTICWRGSNLFSRLVGDVETAVVTQGHVPLSAASFMRGVPRVLRHTQLFFSSFFPPRILPLLNSFPVCLFPAAV